MERHARNKLEQQVVHEQAMALVKLSQKEKRPKQNELIKDENTKKKRKGKEKEDSEEGEEKKNLAVQR